MSPALAYLVLQYAFGLVPVLGTRDECLVALTDVVPSILFGSYGVLRRADGMAPNVGGYTGDHASVLVGIDDERLVVDDPLPSDKTRYSGERSRSSASLRAVRLKLASVRRMTRGDAASRAATASWCRPRVGSRQSASGRQEGGRISDSPLR